MWLIHSTVVVITVGGGLVICLPVGVSDFVLFTAAIIFAIIMIVLLILLSLIIIVPLTTFVIRFVFFFYYNTIIVILLIIIGIITITIILFNKDPTNTLGHNTQPHRYSRERPRYNRATTMIM